MTRTLRLSSVAVVLLAACQTDPDGGRNAQGSLRVEEAPPAELALLPPGCAETLPKARTLVLQGADCSERALRHCLPSVGQHKSLDRELAAMVDRCGILGNMTLVGVTFDDGCAEEVRLSDALPTGLLRCLADELNEARLDCAEGPSCALVEVSTLAQN